MGRSTSRRPRAATPLLTGAGGVTVSNNGEINITGSGDIDTALSVDNGTVFVDGDAEFSGPTILGNNASVEINDAADSLRLLGQTTLIGPSIVGSGRIVFDGSINVAFFDTIDRRCRDRSRRIAGKHRDHDQSGSHLFDRFDHARTDCQRWLRRSHYQPRDLFGHWRDGGWMASWIWSKSAARFPALPDWERFAFTRPARTRRMVTQSSIRRSKWPVRW